MVENDTLLAFLVPAITQQVEPAATRALAYIFNNSPACRQALIHLVGLKGVTINSTQAEFTADDQSRADVVCFDTESQKRVIIEAKFWAGLMKEQASGYLGLLPDSRPSVLMFIAPDIRLETLWPKIVNQVEEGGYKLGPAHSYNRVTSAAVKGGSGVERRLMLTSWRNLLAVMQDVAENEVIKSDIRQLNGLAERQDSEAFLPLHEGELGPHFARRLVGFRKLIDDVVDAKGSKEGWLSVRGLRVTSQVYGYGRYFRFKDVAGDFWFGANHDQWARRGDTPLWVNMDARFDPNLAQIGDLLKVQPNGRWVPIHLKTGVEYEEILEEVTGKLRTIGKLIGANIP